jgi:probable phosphoglycerate mutase
MTGGLELWLVRHGESTFNAEGRYAGWSDPPLTEAGEEMAAALTTRLSGIEFDGIWRSDKVRTRETARLAGYADPRIDDRLRELNFGELEGLTYFEAGEEWRERLRSFADFQAPGGESTAQVRARVESFLSDLAQGRHLVFSHGGWIRCAMAACGSDRFPDKAELVRIDWPARRILS